MIVDFTRNHYDLLGLPLAYAVEPARLEQAYRALQGRVHPDRFAASPEAERRVAMQWAARANEAYRTLRHPVDRARYLLSLQGFDTGEESNTAMPPEFLMQQMQWREALESGREEGEAQSLESLRAEIGAERQAMLSLLGRALDDERNYEAGCALVRKLRFLDKLEESIDEALADLEDAGR